HYGLCIVALALWPLHCGPCIIVSGTFFSQARWLCLETRGVPCILTVLLHVRLHCPLALSSCTVLLHRPLAPSSCVGYILLIVPRNRGCISIIDGPLEWAMGRQVDCGRWNWRWVMSDAAFPVLQTDHAP